MIIVTGGHVDHGKTSLIKALTGVDTDRLPEEKKRGMTIDLGFAYLPVAGASIIGFVDVPGHERFIHNMIAGISGVDSALIVVAADDGPMPQTREHIAILELIGVRHATAVITKTDRASADRILQVEEDIAGLLVPTIFAGAAIFRVSAVTGSGIQALTSHLRSLAVRMQERRREGNFRLSVDRSFILNGKGLIATGTVISGEVNNGDTVRILRCGAKARVRSVHAQHASAARAVEGQRCALNLVGIADRAELVRGDWIVNGDVPGPFQKLDVSLRVLNDAARPLSHWAQIHVHVGAAYVAGHVAVLGTSEIMPGEQRLAQLVLKSPVGALNGDPFILRDPSTRCTLGGGTVLDVFPPRRGRSRPERLVYLRAMGLTDHQRALEALLRAVPSGLSLQEFAANRNLTPDSAWALYVRSGMRRAGGWGFTSAHWAFLRASILALVAAWHARLPDRPGPADNQVLQGSGLRVPKTALEELIDELVRDGDLVRESSTVHLPSHRPTLSPADRALWDNCCSWFSKSPLRPPTVAELAVAVGKNVRDLDTFLSRVERHGLVTRVSKKRFFLPEAVRQLRKLAAADADEAGWITAASFRNRSQVGRNITVELLEYFDRIHFTRRAGNAHLIVRAIKPQDSEGENRCVSNARL